MSRLKKQVPRLWKRKKASAPQSPDEAILQAEVALTEYKPDDHPDIIEWLERPDACDSYPGLGTVGMQKVPLKRPGRGSQEEFRRSWNSHGLDVEIPEGSIDVKFDQLRTVDILDPVERRERNDSGVSLVEDFTRPPKKHPAEAVDIIEAGILELGETWESREGRLRDLIEEHAENCRECWHEACWA